MRRIAFAWVSAVVGALFASAAGAQAPVPAPLPGAAAEAKKAAEPLKPGLHERTVKLNEHERSYLVYVPQSYDANRPTPVVLCYHGAATNGAITIALTGLNNKADEAGFVVVYPDGTSRNGFLGLYGSASRLWHVLPGNDLAHKGVSGIVHVSALRLRSAGENLHLHFFFQRCDQLRLFIFLHK